MFNLEFTQIFVFVQIFNIAEKRVLEKSFNYSYSDQPIRTDFQIFIISYNIRLLFSQQVL